MWLRDELVMHNNCVFYKEYDFGHLAFLMPVDKTIFHEMFALIKRYNPLYRGGVDSERQVVNPEQVQAEQSVTANVAHMTLASGAFLQTGSRVIVIDGFLNKL